MSDNHIHTGGCLCGAVTYTAKGPLRPVIACHCVQCRKTSGHHVAATSAKASEVVIAGRDPAQLRWYESSDSAKRGFCAKCGSNLFWDGHASDRLSIFAGTIDGKTGLKTAGHIFCDFKGDYYEIPEGEAQAPLADMELTTQ